MNIGNAFAFFLSGVVMWCLPNLAPGWFAATGIDGSSARALWLQVMGVVHLVVGAGLLVQDGLWARLVPALAADAPRRPARALVPEFRVDFPLVAAPISRRAPATPIFRPSAPAWSRPSFQLKRAVSRPDSVNRPSWGVAGVR